jgi:YD repeat-containing protein
MQDNGTMPTAQKNPFLWLLLPSLWACLAASPFGLNAGNAIKVTEPNGNITSTQYDSRNRPLTTSDSLGQRSSNTYDAAASAAAGATPIPVAHERIQWDGLHARRSFEITANDTQRLRSDTDAAELPGSKAPKLFNRTSYEAGQSSTTQLHSDHNANLTATVVSGAETAKADSVQALTMCNIF